jgi:cellulose synthase operon protein C
MAPARAVPVVTIALAGLGAALAVGWAPDAAADGAAAAEAAVEQQLRTGQYERARRGADVLARRKLGGARGSALAARAERALGLLAEARRRLERALVLAPDDLTLRAELVLAADALGDRGAVKDLVNRSYDDWEGGRVDRKSAVDLLAMAVIVRHDNNWEDANSALRTALRQRPQRPDDRQHIAVNLAWGDLFLEKHAADNARRCFDEVLAVDPQNPDARTGRARVLLEQGYDGEAAERELAAALAVNPRHAGALAVRGEMALDMEDWPAVTAQVAALRRTNPQDPGAAWLAASLALLRDQRPAYEAERERRLEVRAADAGFFAQVAEALVRHRRYEDAKDVAADGVERDGSDARLLASLGNTLLRLGEEDEGLKLLRRAWDRDPYDARTYNLLNLFEKVIATRYTTVTTKNLRFRVEAAQRPVIEAVVAPFLEETFERYAARYGFRPAAPVVFELYTAPEHYAVRTVGLPRLGVAGVCFGRVITSQAPANGAFNWGMVLAHELAHVFSLQLSRSRVPRWFTEGLAEVETARLRPDWRRQTDLELAAAWKAGKLPPLGELSSAFLRARDDAGASLAYMQAAAAVDMLERRFGFAKLRAALVAWGRGDADQAVLEALAGTPLPALEAAFRQDLGQRLGALATQFLPALAARQPPLPAGRTAAAAGEPRAAGAVAEAGLRSLAAGDERAAAAALARARTRPGGAGDPQVQFLDASLALKQDRAADARRTLQALAARGLAGYDVELRLGLCALRLGDGEAALTHLRAAAGLAPGSVEAKALLAEHLRALAREDEQLAVETEIMRLEPQTASLAKRVALGHARAGRTGLAADMAASALFIDPDDPDLHAALGRALFTQGKTREAALALEQALLFAPEDPRPIHRALADSYDKLGEPRKAAHHRARATAPPPAPPPR